MILALVFQAKGREFPARQKACQAGLPATFVRRGISSPAQKRKRSEMGAFYIFLSFENQKTFNNWNQTLDFQVKDREFPARQKACQAGNLVSRSK